MSAPLWADASPAASLLLLCDELNHLFHRKGGANGSAAYRSLPPEAIFANSLGVLLVAFGLLVLLLLSNRGWRRPEAGPQEPVYSVRTRAVSVSQSLPAVS